jgi:hypothetical protein
VLRAPVFDPEPLPALFFDPDVLFPLAAEGELRLAEALLPPDLPLEPDELPLVAFTPLDLLPVVAVLVVVRPEPVVDFDVPPLDRELVPRPPPPGPDLSPAPLPEPALAVADLLVDFDALPDARLVLLVESPDLAVPLELAPPELFFAVPVLLFAPADFEVAFEPLPVLLADPFAAPPDLVLPEEVRAPDLEAPPPAFAPVFVPTAICAALEAAPTTAPLAASPANSTTTFFAWSKTLSSVSPFFEERLEPDLDPLVCLGISIPLFFFSTRTRRRGC